MVYLALVDCILGDFFTVDYSELWEIGTKLQMQERNQALATVVGGVV